MGLEAFHLRSNIYIRENHAPVLLDFGSARKTSGAATRTLTTLVTPGYAPFEQYYAKSSKQGPWTDIYAMGATLYHASVGTCPPDALARSEAILCDTADPYTCPRCRRPATATAWRLGPRLTTRSHSARPHVRRTWQAGSRKSEVKPRRRRRAGIRSPAHRSSR